jgi:hypothetical protein
MKPWLRIRCASCGIGLGGRRGLCRASGARRRSGAAGDQRPVEHQHRQRHSRDASALSRARVALFGLLALPAKEAMYFTARTDSDGAPLNGNCTYTVSGGELDARWWSITLYKGEGWLVKNAANRWSVAGNAPVRDAQGNWSFTVSPEKADGVWLPTGTNAAI